MADDLDLESHSDPESYVRLQSEYGSAQQAATKVDIAALGLQHQAVF